MYGCNGLLASDGSQDDGGKSIGITGDLLEKVSIRYSISGENVYTGVSLMISCLGGLCKMNEVQALPSDLC